VLVNTKLEKVFFAFNKKKLNFRCFQNCGIENFSKSIPQFLRKIVKMSISCGFERVFTRYRKFFKVYTENWMKRKKKGSGIENEKIFYTIKMPILWWFPEFSKITV
jgi:hypothetical protein